MLADSFCTKVKRCINYSPSSLIYRDHNRLTQNSLGLFAVNLLDISPECHHFAFY